MEKVLQVSNEYKKVSHTFPFQLCSTALSFLLVELIALNFKQ